MKSVEKAWKSLGFLFLAIIALIVATFIYSRSLSNVFEHEIVSLLSEVAEQSSSAYERDINRVLKEIEDVAGIIGKQEGFNTDEILDVLEVVVENQGFKRMTIIDLQGNAKTTDGFNIYLGEQNHVTSSLNGVSSIQSNTEDKVNGGAITIYSAPIYKNGTVVGVLSATQNYEMFRSILETEAFEGKSYSCIVNKFGDIIAESAHSTELNNTYNIFSDITSARIENTDAVERLKIGMEKRAKGYVVYQDLDEEFLYYTPLGIQDWYLLTIVPSSLVSEKKDFLMGLTYQLYLVVLLTFMLFALYHISIQSKGKKKLEQMLFVDKITGGHTYEKFKIEASELFKKPRASKCYAVCSLDIDYFKYINDIYGFETGNQAIRYIWETIKNCTNTDTIFAHRMADRFDMVMSYETQNDLITQLKKIEKELSHWETNSGKMTRLVPSIGVFEIDDYTQNIENMMDKARIAKKKIKSTNACFAFYDNNLRSKMNREKYIEDHMKGALEKEEFLVYYQPKYDAVTQALVGAEALVRWKDETHGLMPPGTFIPLFERNGFILQLDKYVFEKVISKIRDWIDAGIDVKPVMVNISQLNLHNLDFVESYKNILLKYNVPSKYVQLELTETALNDNMEVLLKVIQSLQDIGFMLLMDDFGTGYSSLKLLKDIPVNAIKLDKSFIDDIDTTKGNGIISAVINLAHTLGMKVVAEGVELESQYERVRDMGCDEVQGYYFSRPIEVERFEKILQ